MSSRSCVAELLELLAQHGRALLDAGNLHVRRIMLRGTRRNGRRPSPASVPVQGAGPSSPRPGPSAPRTQAPGTTRPLLPCYSDLMFVFRILGVAAMCVTVGACASIGGLDQYSECPGGCLDASTDGGGYVVPSSPDAGDEGPDDASPQDGATALEAAAGESGAADGETEDAAEDSAEDSPPTAADGGCPAGLAACGDDCVDLTDPANCGACGNACAAIANAAPTCTAGTCSFACNAGYSLCNGACVEFTTASNCGSCGKACGGSTAVCAGLAGAYSCVSGCPSAAPTNCGGSCVDTTSDANNCNSCGRACTTSVANAQAVCVKSACSIACDTGYALCNGACIQLDTAVNCGSCGNACSGATPT